MNYGKTISKCANILFGKNNSSERSFFLCTYNVFYFLSFSHSLCLSLEKKSFFFFIPFPRQLRNVAGYGFFPRAGACSRSHTFKSRRIYFIFFLPRTLFRKIFSACTHNAILIARFPRRVLTRPDVFLSFKRLIIV